MPFISVKTTHTLSEQQKVELKKGIGQIITILPNKSEKVLMVDIDDGHTMFMAGEKQESCAFVDARIYGAAPFAAKKEFTEHMFLVLEQSIGIPKDKAFLSITQYDNWGTKGSMK